MKNIKSLSISELEKYFEEIGEKKYRTMQVFTWLWKKGIRSFEEMTDIKKELRIKLSQEFYIFRLSKERIVKSKDGSIKFLFGTEDDKYIESVFIPDKKRKTVCVSSQIGCSLKCKICRTGKDGFIRNLRFYEIAQQVVEIEKYVKEKITNVVFMGMGEPLLNIEDVLKAIEIVNHPSGLSIGKRHITVSTAGVVPGIYELISRGIKQIKVAVSLNSPFNDVRNLIMPINKKYPIEELLKSIKDFTKHTKKRVTIEYVLIKGLTDRQKDAKRLIKILKGIPLKINLIPYNKVKDERFETPGEKRVKQFAELLYPYLPTVSIRKSKGQDIKSACGQLRAFHKKNK